MNVLVKFIACVAVLHALAACEADRMSERGFSLPPGDPIAGRAAFVYMHCYECHTIAGEEFPALTMSEPLNIELGGRVTRVKSYGELVTAIINPSHKLASGYEETAVSRNGESLMPVYNGYMTVQELIDIVMFLQPYYDVTVPAFRYPIYP